jgi:thymidylate kinase
LEGFPRTKLEAEILMKHNFHIDAFILLKVDSDVAAKRIYSDKRQKARLAKRKAVHAIASAIGDMQENLLSLKAAEATLSDVENREEELIDEITDM